MDASNSKTGLVIVHEECRGGEEMGWLENGRSGLIIVSLLTLTA